MTVRLPPDVSLSDIPAGGVLADSDWHDDDGTWEPVSFASKAVNGKVRVRLADLVKLGGPEGYIHGYICVRPPCGPAHKEAEFNGKAGEVRHGDVRIGKMRKNDDGTYSMVHTGDNGRVKLTARYATRADAAKSLALYHNVDKLHGQAIGPATREPIDRARKALAAGDTGSAVMFLAQAEVKANHDGDKKLASHLVDVRAAIVDGPKAVSPPDMAGPQPRVGKPVPGLPPKHAPLPEDVKQAVNQHLIALAFGHHWQVVKDALASARTAVDAGNADQAMKHLADAHVAAFNADDVAAMDHAADAHDLIAAHLGLPLLKRHVNMVPPIGQPKMPPVSVPVSMPSSVPAEPKVKKLPKAKAAVVDGELNVAGDDAPFGAKLLVDDARDAIKNGNLVHARNRIARAHAILGDQSSSQARRDHLALADEQLAAHLKVAPFQARTITHADEQVNEVSRATRNLVTARVNLGVGNRLEYLLKKEDIASRLRAGNAAQVIRDLRELDTRAREQQNFDWNSERKAAIGAARKDVTAAKRVIEKLHQQDLSEQSFEDRASKLAGDIVPHDRGWRPVAPPLRLAVDELAKGELANASKALINARDAAASQPRSSQARQFEKDIADLHAEVSKVLQAQLAGSLGQPEAEPSTATGFLGNVETERNRISTQLVRAIKSGVKSKKSPTVKGAVGETSLVTFGDGSTWVHKAASHDDGDDEELASMVARAIGARAPVVIRDPLNPDAVYMTLVHGKTAMELKKSSRAIIGQRGGGTPAAADAMRKIGFLDYLIKNADRHGGNFMIDQDNMPVAIDHGLAWGYNSRGSDVTTMVSKGDFSPEYYAGVKKNLESLRPGFIKVVGADNKYHDVMNQLDKWMKWNDNGSNRPN